MDDLDKPLTQIDRLILHLDNDLSPPCLESLRDEIVALEARIAKADALAEAHGKLWSALAEIIEAPGMSPNATVRRMAARAEKALVEDSIADVKPVPRFYRESDT